MLLSQTSDIPVVPMPDVEQTGKGAFDALKGLSFDDAVTKIANGTVDFAFKLLIAILVFYAGKFLIKRMYRMVQTIMVRRNVDASLTTFVLSLIKMVSYFILIIIVIGILGIETSSFIALFASAGVAIGMALSGTLQNFAGGVLILLLKPYKVGDYIEAQGYSGFVKAINIFNTVINTPDNKSIIIPNGGLSTSSVNNYSLESYRRVDWTIGLSYSTDFDAARETILKMLNDDPRVVKGFKEDDIIERRQAKLKEDQERLEKMRSEGADQKEIDNLSHQIAEEEEEDCGDNHDCKDGTLAVHIKESWWKRMCRRSRRRQEMLQNQIRDRINARAGQPAKTDCTPFVGLNELADSSINLVVRAWTPSKDYWNLYFDMNRRFFTELPRHGFEFPFPQLDVHMDSPAPQALPK